MVSDGDISSIRHACRENTADVQLAMIMGGNWDCTDASHDVKHLHVWRLSCKLKTPHGPLLVSKCHYFGSIMLAPMLAVRLPLPP